MFMTEKTMWALRYHGHPELVLERLPLPEPGAGAVRIRPLAVGIDGTDAHVLAGEFPVKIPIVTGHEIAGKVEAVGQGVTNLREGDLVCIEPHVYCTKCRYCLTAREHLCIDKKAFGFHLNGGLAEAMVVPERVAYLVPSGLGPEIACLAEPVGCCIHGMDRLEPVSGMGVIIFGAGTVGCILIQLAKFAGLTPIVAVEPQPDRRQMAGQFGADAAFDPADEGWKEQALALTNQIGFDLLVDAVGSGKIIEEALTMTARGARLLVFGVASPGDIANIKPYRLFYDELSIIATTINPYTHYRAVDLLPHLGLERLAIRQFPLDEYKIAYSELGRGGKVAISPQVMSSDQKGGQLET
jgi:threonine dehydrogenase-like Zn-dependent dehydrogenase